MAGPQDSALMQFAFIRRPDWAKSFREHIFVFAGAIGFMLVDNVQRALAHTDTPVLSTAAGFFVACVLKFSWRAFPMLGAAITLMLAFTWTEPLFSLRRFSLLIVIALTYPILHATWQKREIAFLRVRDILYPFVLYALLVAGMGTLLLSGMATVWAKPHNDIQFLMHTSASLAVGISLFSPAIYFLLQDRSHLSILQRSIWENAAAGAALLFLIVIAGMADAPARPEMEILAAATFPALAWIALRNGLRAVSLAMAASALGVVLVRLLAGPGMWERTVVNDTTYYGLVYLICVVCLILGTQRDTIAANDIKARLALAANDFCPWDWTYKGGIVFRSPAWARKVGLSTDVAQPLEQWIATVHPEEHQNFADSIMAGAQSEHNSFNMRFRSKDVHTGEWFWTKSIGLILKKDANGQPLQAVGIVVDIHDAIENEDARIDLIQRKAELRELRTQLNPHFLFNSLNSIRALVEKDPARAREMITMLSGLLRYLLRARDRNFDTLEAEMEVVQKYLTLEKIRFGDRLKIIISIDPASLNCSIPGMLVLTLVENAVKHGISKLEHGGIIRIETKLSRSALLVRVLNSGRLSALEQGGVGLENTRRRVQLLAGSLASFDIRQEKDDKVCAILILPRESLNLSQAYAEEE